MHSKKPSNAENLSQFEEQSASSVRIFGKDSKSVTSKGGIFSQKNQRGEESRELLEVVTCEQDDQGL